MLAVSLTGMVVKWSCTSTPCRYWPRTAGLSAGSGRTPALVRAWWDNRGRVREYLADHRAAWEAGDAQSGQGVAAAARDYAAYIDSELETHLRAYLFWLTERRVPTPADSLPPL
jgi:hypothetical protein